MTAVSSKRSDFRSLLRSPSVRTPEAKTLEEVIIGYSGPDPVSALLLKRFNLLPFGLSVNESHKHFWYIPEIGRIGGQISQDAK